MFGEGRGEASDATTEIEGGSLLVRREAQRLQMTEDRVNFLPTSGKELLGNPLATMPGRVRADGPQWICPGKTLPVFLQLA